MNGPGWYLSIGRKPDTNLPSGHCSCHTHFQGLQKSRDKAGELTEALQGAGSRGRVLRGHTQAWHRSLTSALPQPAGRSWDVWMSSDAPAGAGGSHWVLCTGCRPGLVDPSLRAPASEGGTKPPLLPPAAATEEPQFRGRLSKSLKTAS